MWRQQGTVININSGESFQRQIISNLNPNAKEFYPNYVRSWRSRPEQKVSLQEKVFKSYSVTFWPVEQTISILEKLKGLMFYKFQIESQANFEFGQQIVTESKKHARIIKPNSNMGNKIPVNKTNGAIKKIPAKWDHSQKSGVPTRLSSASSITKPILKNKLSTSPLQSSRPMSSSGNNTPKDAASIKSNSSSDKSYGVRFSKAALNSVAPINKTLAPTKNNKSKESLPKTPRSTVASNLRKTETQKVS
ncbi:uncharacterized protein LOC109613143 [Musca domestica]|uniref:Uncharacterized protein LOC109613143 n=1 Tax=Musca domestica TaxID=7370 RepID=A0A9J7DJE6_MUSDO|nr:uncharacterized protein LOC109613143 [Musca domestica]